MAKLKWDQLSERLYETGASHCALFPMDATKNSYATGVAWNGFTGLTENRGGAEETALWANDNKYLSLRSKETFGGTITAYTYPSEWKECDGEVEIGKGITIGQQPRKPFGLAYRTLIGNDTALDAHGYKLHLVYNATASPSSREYKTENDSPEAIEFSWEFTTTPIEMEGHSPVSEIEIDSTECDAKVLKQIEDLVYGTAEKEPTLPSPAEIAAMIGGAAG